MEGGEEVAVGAGRDEGRVLRAEVGAREEDRRGLLADDGVEAGEVGEGNLSLAPEDRVDVVAAEGGRDVPLLDVADAAGMLEPHRRDEGDVAEACAAEVGEEGAAGEGEAVGLGGKVGEVGVGDGAELLEVISDVEMGVVEGRLADDRIEVETALGHASGRRGRFVALGVHEDVAGRLGLGVETLGDEDGRAVEEDPRLPVFIGETEEIPRADEADHVDADRVEEVGGDLAEHLIGLDDADGRAGGVEAEGLAEEVDRGDVHAGDRGAALIEGD